MGKKVDISKPISSDFRTKINAVYKNFCQLALYICGIYHINVVKVDYDYSKYLGKNYDKNAWESTVLSNHTSVFDPIILGALYGARMVSKDGLKTVPFIGWCASLNETIYVDWGSDAKTKEKIIDTIWQAQQDYFDNKTTKPLGIFPEGTTTNGTCLLKFKHGAFISKLPVKPHVIKLTSKYYSPAYDCVRFIEWLLFFLL